MEDRSLSRSGWLVTYRNKHNCVLSNAGLSNAITETRICTSPKSDLYFRFHSPVNTKSALQKCICTWDLVLMCWKMWSPEPENCRNRNPHTSKIGKLLPVCLTNSRRSDHISEPHTKFGENRWRIVDVIPNLIQTRNLRTEFEIFTEISRTLPTLISRCYITFNWQKCFLSLLINSKSVITCQLPTNIRSVCKYRKY